MPHEPVILAFDTSAAHCAAALLVGDEILISRHEEMSRGQAERLMDLLEEILAEAGLGWTDLSAIGVGTGPGNFTGIRISVAAARGLALGLGVPAVGVSSLEAQAFGRPRPVTSILPARGGQVYAQRFGESGVQAAWMAEEGWKPDEATAGALGPGELVRRIALVAGARLAARTLSERPAPLYIRAAGAAPPRDPAPCLLDG